MSLHKEEHLHNESISPTDESIVYTTDEYSLSCITLDAVSDNNTSIDDSEFEEDERTLPKLEEEKIKNQMFQEEIEKVSQKTENIKNELQDVKKVFDEINNRREAFDCKLNGAQTELYNIKSEFQSQAEQQKMVDIEVPAQVVAQNDASDMDKNDSEIDKNGHGGSEKVIIDKVIKQLNELKTELVKVTAEKNSLSLKHSQATEELKKTSNEKSEHENMLNQLKNKLEEKQTQMKELESELSETKSDLQSISNEKLDYIIEINDFKDKIDEMNSQKQELEKKYNSLKEKLEETTSDDESATKSREQQKSNDDSQKNALEEELNCVKSELDALRHEEQQTSAQLIILKKELQDETEEKEKLKQEKENCRAEHRNTVHELEKILKEKEEYQHKIDINKETVQKTNTENELLVAQNQDKGVTGHYHVNNGNGYDMNQQKRAIFNDIDETVNRLSIITSADPSEELNKIHLDIEKIALKKKVLKQLLKDTKLEVGYIFHQNKDELVDVREELKKVMIEKENLKNELNCTRSRLESIMNEQNSHVNGDATNGHVSRHMNGHVATNGYINGDVINGHVVNSSQSKTEFCVLKSIGAEIEAKAYLDDQGENEVDEVVRLRKQINRLHSDRELYEKQMCEMRVELEEAQNNSKTSILELNGVKNSLAKTSRERELFEKELSDIKEEIERVTMPAETEGGKNEEKREEEEGSKKDGDKSETKKRKTDLEKVRAVLQRVAGEQEAFAAEVLSTKKELEGKYDKLRKDNLGKSEHLRKTIQCVLSDLSDYEKKMKTPKVFGKKRSSVKRKTVARLQSELKTSLENFTEC